MGKRTTDLGWTWAAAAGCAALVAVACGSALDETPGGPSGGAGGSGGGVAQGGDVGCIDNLVSVQLTPADDTVTLDGHSAAPIAFTATGRLANGDTVDIEPTALLWEVARDDDTPPGEITDGILSPFPFAGGVVTVTASDTCVEASTTVTFFVDAVIGDPGDPAEWTGTPTTDGAPVVVYPSDETRFPRNLYRTLFQWYSQDFTSFRLTFEGANSKVVVFTDGAHGLCADANPAAGCWEVGETVWSLIAASNAGDIATWTVDALDTSTVPPTIRRSDSIELGFSKQDVEGAIFYWSTTSAGVRRGRISEQDPQDYIVGKPNGTTYGDDEVGCVACHTISRDGRYMVAPVKSDAGDSLWIMEVTADAPPNPIVTDVTDTGGHGFGTISPDNEHVVVSFKDDFMWMVDRATGAFQGQLPTDAFEGGTHPDWSPAGDQLVFATGKGDAPGGSSLAIVPWDGTGWGTPFEILAPPSGSSNLFPMFDFSGEWIAFSQGDGGHGDRTAQLWVVRPDGSMPVECVKANRVTNNEITDGQYQNSQPTWAPPGDYDWVAFNSKRPYGVVLGEGTQQIWVAAIDRSKAASDQDPSYPAFRVPFQGLEENNHRAFWTLDIGMGGGGSGGSGGAGGGDPCEEILTLGDECDPLNDCCETASYCDTDDDGATYECITLVPN